MKIGKLYTVKFNPPVIGIDAYCVQRQIDGQWDVLYGKDKGYFSINRIIATPKSILMFICENVGFGVSIFLLEDRLVQIPNHYVEELEPEE